MTSDESGSFARTAQLIRGFQFTKMIEVAATLGLADRIDERSVPVGELAEACGADPDMLLRLCRALAAFGVFHVEADGRIGHSRDSRWLRRDARPTLHQTAAYWGIPGVWAAWGNLEQTIRTGRPAFELTLGQPYFDYLSTHPAEAQIFDSYMQHSPDDRHKAVAEAYGFTGAVVDVGGGNGALIAAILAAHGGVQGILFDQESVVTGAPAALGQLARRCRIEPGNFFERVPPGGDIYLLSQILHDWNDERCTAILSNCRAAMGPQARLLVIERVLDAGSANPMNYLADMHMMVLFPGAKERTLAEYDALFRNSGFGAGRLIPTRSAFSIVETSPA